jgi:hypothetical protein
MAFQSAVQILQGVGVPGELYDDSPVIAATYTLNSVLPAYNVIGSTAYTVQSQGFVQAGSGGAFGYAGILVDPKVYALYGVGGQPLAPSLVLPNNGIAELLTMGTIFVILPAAANIGDWVIFDNTTGALSTVAPLTSLPSGKSWANAIVYLYNVTGAGLAVIQVNPGIGVPT